MTLVHPAIRAHQDKPKTVPPPDQRRDTPGPGLARCPIS
jgi:hypothetical protein